MKQKLFRESSMRKMLAGEDDTLAAYVKNISLKSWVSLAAVLLTIVSILIWALTSVITNKTEITGISANGYILCFLTPEECNNISVGTQVVVEEVYTANIVDISAVQYSKKEVEEMFSLDYYKSNITLNEWNRAVVITCDNQEAYEQTLVSITVKSDSVNLINYFKN